MPPKKDPAPPKKTSRTAAARSAVVDKFEFMFEHSIVGKSFTLPSGKITVNQAFCDILGYTRAELQKKPGRRSPTRRI